MKKVMLFLFAFMLFASGVDAKTLSISWQYDSVAEADGFSIYMNGTNLLCKVPGTARTASCPLPPLAVGVYKFTITATSLTPVGESAHSNPFTFNASLGVPVYTVGGEIK